MAARSSRDGFHMLKVFRDAYFLLALFLLIPSSCSHLFLAADQCPTDPHRVQINRRRIEPLSSFLFSRAGGMYGRCDGPSLYIPGTRCHCDSVTVPRFTRTLMGCWLPKVLLLFITNSLEGWVGWVGAPYIHTGWKINPLSIL